MRTGTVAGIEAAARRILGIKALVAAGGRMAARRIEAMSAVVALQAAKQAAGSVLAPTAVVEAVVEEQLGLQLAAFRKGYYKQKPKYEQLRSKQSLQRLIVNKLPSEGCSQRKF